jgi:hypothetical protein
MGVAGPEAPAAEEAAVAELVVEAVASPEPEPKPKAEPKPAQRTAATRTKSAAHKPKAPKSRAAKPK